MKIVIVYASAGAGHLKAAQTVYNFLKEHCQESKVSLIDVLEKSNALFKAIYTYGYAFLVKYAPTAWSCGFRITHTKYLRFFTRPVAALINRLNTRNFVRFLVQENPDFVISTHFLPSEIAACLKKEQKIASKLITVITDFGVHAFWLNGETDIYLAASDFTRRCLIRNGVGERKIKVSGIPVGPKFFLKPERKILANKLNIDKDRFTVLIVTGSFGIGPIEKIVDSLRNDVQILAVCAHNKRLFARLIKRGDPGVKVFGFINNVQELMAVSDIIITKPGGLSISEILSMELPPVFISAIPGQEKENANIMERYGIGFKAENVKDIRNIVLDYKGHPDKLEKIRENMRDLKKPDTLKEICNVVCPGGSGPSC